MVRIDIRDASNLCVCLMTVALTAAVMASGCSDALPRVKPPQIDARAAAEGALAEFDADGDQTLRSTEACMGIQDQWERYDTDSDGQVSLDELQTRFAKWSSGDTGMMNLRAEVRYRGQPLRGARVEMIPYAFLGDDLQAAEGETDNYGYAFLAIPKANLPKSQQTNHGMQVGLYRVSISHPKQDLPARYHEDTVLSVDLSPNEANTGVRFDLP